MTNKNLRDLANRICALDSEARQKAYDAVASGSLQDVEDVVVGAELRKALEDLDSHRQETKMTLNPVTGTELHICIDADCPSCGWAERWYSPDRQVFGCSKCPYESEDRNS